MPAYQNLVCHSKLPALVLDWRSAALVGSGDVGTTFATRAVYPWQPAQREANDRLPADLTVRPVGPESFDERAYGAHHGQQQESDDCRSN